MPQHPHGKCYKYIACIDEDQNRQLSVVHPLGTTLVPLQPDASLPGWYCDMV